MLCIYVGKTTIPLIQRLRKHATTATACAEESAFHDVLRPVLEIECIPKLVIIVSDCIPGFRSVCPMCIPTFKCVYHMCIPTFSSFIVLHAQFSSPAVYFAVDFWQLTLDYAGFQKC